MTRFPGAPRGSQLVIVGDQALSEAEYELYRAHLDRDNARRRARRAADPEYRERWNGYHREYRRRNDPRQPIRAVASLHSLRCTGPTRSTGCRCRKVTLYERVAA